MAVVELAEPRRVQRLLGRAPLELLEALDESARGREGQVTVFAEDEPDPPSFLAVRWGQKDLGLGSWAALHATRLTGLEALLEALPEGRGRHDLWLPFWASPLLGGRFQVEPLGARAFYAVGVDTLRPSPVAARTTRLDDPSVVRPMFPKLVEELPIFVLALGGQLTAVAAATHAVGELARLAVYTVEAARGRGFGRGVLTALAAELLALGWTPTLAVALGEEPAVRLVESAGFRQTSARLEVRLSASPGAGWVGSVGRARRR